MRCDLVADELVDFDSDIERTDEQLLLHLDEMVETDDVVVSIVVMIDDVLSNELLIDDLDEVQFDSIDETDEIEQD